MWGIFQSPVLFPVSVCARAFWTSARARLPIITQTGYNYKLYNGVTGLGEGDAADDLLDLVLAGGAVHVVLGALLGLDLIRYHHRKLAAVKE